LRASLKQNGSRCALLIANTVGGIKSDALSTGMGAQLMQAFAIQLGGPIDVAKTEDEYIVSLEFDVQDFGESSVDY
jgi:two-component sensor histidine kinase